jgi:hypothetical protein
VHLLDVIARIPYFAYRTPRLESPEFRFGGVIESSGCS